MTVLTVGNIASIIATCVFAVRIFIPNTLVLILVALVNETTSAAGWSALARQLYSSYWPTILSTDSQTSTGVPRSIKTGSWTRTAVMGVVSIASVITPLGLYETISPGSGEVPRSFEYTPDTSPMRYGSPPRSNLLFNRKCGFFEWVNCPGSNTVVITNNTAQTIDYPYGYNTTIPQDKIDAFQSGLKTMSPTISSIRDIQWRSYNLYSDMTMNNGSKYIAGEYHQKETMVLNNAIEPVEGLIVDTQAGGIGFRNHTTPSSSTYGTTWTEDLLFIEPQTACVDMNISLDFVLNQTSGTSVDISQIVLTDRGGFANADKIQPNDPNGDNPQLGLDLHRRAYKGAWYSNAWTMAYLNVTNPDGGGYAHSFAYLDSTIGKQFPMTKTALSSTLSYNTFLTSVTWGDFLDLSSNSTNVTNSSTVLTYPNPFGVTADNFALVATTCEGALKTDLANITNVGVACGMVYGAARRTDGSNSMIFEPGSRWSIPLYSCASATRALIKTVDFRFNGTDGLKSLAVTSVSDKTYPDTNSMPLWGVENSDLTLQDGPPLWGLISQDYQGRSDISALQQESLWLSGFTGYDTFDVTLGSDYNIPAIVAPVSSLAYTYSLSAQDLKITNVADYTGVSNIAMYTLWQQYSKTANTAAQIVNLIWTDIAANSLIGTRGWLGSSAASESLSKRDGDSTEQIANVNVVVYDKVIQYHWLYAIPAIIVLIFAALMLVATIALVILGRGNVAMIRRYLNITSVGRVMTSFVYPGQIQFQAPTKAWVVAVGNKNVDVSGQVPRAVDPVMMVNYGNATAPDDPLLYKENLPVHVSPKESETSR